MRGLKDSRQGECGQFLVFISVTAEVYQTTTLFAARSGGLLLFSSHDRPAEGFTVVRIVDDATSNWVQVCLLSTTKFASTAESANPALVGEALRRLPKDEMALLASPAGRSSWLRRGRRSFPRFIATMAEALKRTNGLAGSVDSFSAAGRDALREARSLVDSEHGSPLSLYWVLIKVATADFGKQASPVGCTEAFFSGVTKATTLRPGPALDFAERFQSARPLEPFVGHPPAGLPPRCGPLPSGWEGQVGNQN